MLFTHPSNQTDAKQDIHLKDVVWCYHGECENSEYRMPIGIPVVQYRDCAAALQDAAGRLVYKYSN